MNIPEHIKMDASRILKAQHNRDWSLHAHLMRRYPFGSDERKQLDIAIKEGMAADYPNVAPEYFH